MCQFSLFAYFSELLPCASLIPVPSAFSEAILPTLKASASIFDQEPSIPGTRLLLDSWAELSKVQKACQVPVVTFSAGPLAPGVLSSCVSVPLVPLRPGLSPFATCPASFPSQSHRAGDVCTVPLFLLATPASCGA